MPVAEIGAALSSLKTAYDLAKAMKDVRDATVIQGKVFELQRVIIDAQASAIEAREAHSAQTDQIRALEAEIARLKNWDAEKPNYELKQIGEGCVAYMLKPQARGSDPAHWLCATCFAKGQKSFLNPTGAHVGRAWIYKCITCGAQPACSHMPQWDD